MSSNSENEIDHNTSGKSENPLSDPIIIDENNNNLDILIISEIKIDGTFPDSQFLIKGFSVSYRLDRTAKGGGILLYIRGDIPSKRIKKVTFDESFKGFFIGINLRRKKWLPGCSYNPHWDKITPRLRNISTALDKLSTDYENVILLGGFNVEVEEKNLSNFMNVHNLKILIKQKTCFKTLKTQHV